MDNKEIEYLSRGEKSFAVAGAILKHVLQDCEKPVEATKRDMPRILANHLKRENELIRKILRHEQDIPRD